MTTAALAVPYLDGPPTVRVCHILTDRAGPTVYCGSLSGRGPLTCPTGGSIWTVCPDCGLPVCSRCRTLALAGLGAA